MSAEADLVSTPITAELVRGAAELEPTPRGLLPHRLPGWARAQCPDPQLALAESQPAGIRLAVRTAATVIELDTLPTKRLLVGTPPRPAGVYDVVVDGELLAQASADGGDTLSTDMTTGAVEHQRGPVSTLRFAELPDRVKEVEIWLPHNETTTLVELRTDAPVEAAPDRGRRVWLHHGSSISHGSNAEHPTGTWPVRAATAGGVELVNLGMGGSALLDPFTARAMRDTPADLISVKIGINVVGADLMRLRAFGPAVHGFLDTIRDGHPDTPLLVITPICCPIHEDTPGPSGFDTAALAEGRVRFRATGDPAETAAGKLTLQVIRDELTRVVGGRQGADPALHLLDGLTLYGPDDTATHPLPDDLHPDAATHRLIAERFTGAVFADDGVFGRSG